MTYTVPYEANSTRRLRKGARASAVLATFRAAYDAAVASGQSEADATLTARGEVDRARRSRELRRGVSKLSEPRTVVRPLRDVRADAIRAALAACDGNVTDAAARLGIGRATVYRHLERAS